MHNLKFRLYGAGNCSNNLEHLAGRDLVFERLFEVARAGLQLAEQPRVLHRDDRLDREVLQERDLFFRERPHLVAPARDQAEQRPVFAQRQCKIGAQAALGGGARLRIVVDQAHIGNVDKRGPREQGSICGVWRTLNPRRSCSAQSCGTPRIATPQKVSPSNRYSVPRVASQCVRAFSSIASKTGCSSPGEELMTCNTSAVAVCCSRDSRSSVNRRVFSIAMTALLAKVRTSSICRSLNGSTRSRFRASVPTTKPSRSNGTPSIVRIFPSVAVSGTR